MKTVWVSRQPRAPDYVTVKVTSVRQLPRVLDRLGRASPSAGGERPAVA